ncbi:MAG: glucose-6-phosphate isomerase [Cardiobacteriaceae bacterium]|nr:glucose-6-phosphate isomerase [Cardiobacteriaceae bacterium]
MSHIHEKLRAHRDALQQTTLAEKFAADPARMESWQFNVAGIHADLSKNHVDAGTQSLWQQWLADARVADGIKALLAGEHVNQSEDRPALHYRLRSPTDQPFVIDGQDISADIAAMRAHMKTLADNIHSGQWLGYSGKRFTDVIHIGIGGSELGPRLICHALRHQTDKGLTIHFLATPDPYRLQALESLNPETTLLIIASKTFTTEETLASAEHLRAWLRAAGGEKADRQMIAISARTDRAAAFGIDAERVLPMWDWVGGRYSLWSSIALPFVLQNGYAAYEALLSGAHAMDEHFANAEAARNLPIQLALLDTWYNHYFHINNRAVITYSAALEPFPQYLQQLAMESLGKRTCHDGSELANPTGLIIWGGSGTDVQHAFFQLIHQGQRDIPVDFITLKQSDKYPQMQRLLQSHCLAQSEALMHGRSAADLPQDLAPDESAQRVCPGNRPSTTLILDALNPQCLGALLALYENKTSVEALLLGVNAYDQWGVELGKQLAANTRKSLDGATGAHDASTTALINHIKS